MLGDHSGNRIVGQLPAADMDDAYKPPMASSSALTVEWHHDNPSVCNPFPTVSTRQSTMRSHSNIVVAFVLLMATLGLAAKSAGCGKTPTIKSQQYSINVNGKSRQYYMKLPNNYNKDRAYRLVFTWHQLGGSAQKIVNGENINQGGALPYYGLNAIANDSAIFVVPQGLNNGW